MAIHNQINSKEKNFPRSLTNFEKECLFSVLPENKPGYFEYRKKINSLFVIGNGRFGENNFILGNKDSRVDLSNASAPVFAVGKRIYTNSEIYIVIHEESENQIEFDISKTKLVDFYSENSEVKRWSYSDWVPGNKAPGDNSEIHEIIIIPDQVILVIAPNHKKIWIYEKATGINHLIPITNFYNELMKVKKIRDPEVALKSEKFFSVIEIYSQEELCSAFLLYNKFKKKINLDYSLLEKTKDNSSGFLNKIFKRG